jgi:uncharacterized protein
MANRCPICEKPMPGPWQEWPQYPFCTQRCKTIDLGRWLSEDYKVAKPSDEDDDRHAAPSDEQ